MEVLLLSPWFDKFIIFSFYQVAYVSSSGFGRFMQGICEDAKIVNFKINVKSNKNWKIIARGIDHTIPSLSTPNISAALLAQMSPKCAKRDHRHTLIFWVIYHFILYLRHCVSYHYTQ